MPIGPRSCSLFLGLGLFIAAEATGQSAVFEPAIDVPSALRLSEPRGSDLQGWLGLYVGDGRSRLAPTALTAVREGTDDDSLWRLAARTRQQPTFVFRGIAGLKPGAVRTWIPVSLYIDLDTRVPLGSGGELRWVCDAAAGKAIDAAPSDGCSLVLSASGRRQVLIERVSVEAAWGVSIDWAGDLDADGRPDFLLNESGEIASTTLWLSSAATPREIVHPAATYQFEDFC